MIILTGCNVVELSAIKNFKNAIKHSPSCAHVLNKNLNSVVFTLVARDSNKNTSVDNAHTERLFLLIRPMVLWRDSLPSLSSLLEFPCP